MNTVLNTEIVDPMTNPMFLGKGLGLQRYDKLKYPKFFELYKQQWSFFWTPEEVDVSKDIGDYKLLDDRERFIFNSNISFQTMGDSMLSRSIGSLKRLVTNSELELCMGAWAAFEDIHSTSYTHILQNIHSNATAFFDAIPKNKEIVKRADALKSNYDKLLSPSKDPRQEIFDAILGTQIFEGVIFYSSFACSFYFAYRSKMEGNGKIINLISRDENLHVAITQNMLKIMRDVPEEGFQDIVKKNEDKVYDAYKIAVQAEHDWIDYIFSEGSLVGLTPASLKQYVEWLANNRLASMGYRRIFSAKLNPLSGWLDSLYDSKKSQPAPQETEITSYTKAIDSNVTPGKWAKFKL